MLSKSLVKKIRWLLQLRLTVAERIENEVAIVTVTMIVLVADVVAAVAVAAAVVAVVAAEDVATVAVAADVAATEPKSMASEQMPLNLKSNESGSTKWLSVPVKRGRREISRRPFLIYPCGWYLAVTMQV